MGKDTKSSCTELEVGAPSRVRDKTALISKCTSDLVSSTVRGIGPTSLHVGGSPIWLGARKLLRGLGFIRLGIVDLEQCVLGNRQDHADIGM